MAVFRIDPAVFDAFPNARFAAVVARGVNNQGDNPAIADLLDEAVQHVHEHFGGGDPKSDPRISVWREAFGSRGWTPSKYLSSIEALVRRIAKGGEMPRISPAVDLANSVSLSLCVPIGAHDLGTAPNGIEVRLAKPTDRFQPMGEAPSETPDEGEIVYVHDDDVRTRRWVWRQSRSGLVSPQTTDFLFPIDGFAPVTDEAINEAAERLARLVPELLGGTATVYHLDPEHPSTGE
ncbi:MAG TPA: phenylalanine--tRNA ligase beta subunit-related protein [Nitrolancea sp.]|nr:phenylalanine--tRNA ligase beta subunit-related protein [Nitrolancea sp.]